MFEDPLHKYESIPLEMDGTNFVKKQLDTESAEDDEGPDSVNYSYHPTLLVLVTFTYPMSCQSMSI